MYLITLSNMSYVSITILFAALFMVAYINKKHNNQTYLFFTNSNSNPTTNTKSITLLSFVILSTMGAIFGVHGFIVSLFLSLCILSTFKYNKNNIILSILSIVFYLLLIITTMFIMAQITKTLFGWSLVNGILGTTVFTIIYILLGGHQSVKINQKICSMIFTAILLITLFFVFINTTNSSSIIKNIPTILPFHQYHNIILITAVITCLIILLIKHTKPNSPSKTRSKSVFLIISILITLLGVIAIATPPKTNIIGNKQIITYQEASLNGEVSYIIKMVDKNTPHTSNATYGIIPSYTTPTPTPTHTANYLMSGIIVLVHYLPPPLYFLILLILFALFISSVAKYTTNINQIFIEQILIPYKLLDQYKDIGLIWCSRLTITSIPLISITITALIFKILPS